LAANRARVALNGREQATIDATLGGGATGIAADCSAFAAVERLRHEVEEHLGSVEILACLRGWT